MPEIDNVQIGETIAVEWGNAIRDRTIQRYANAAERDELHPTPTEGDLSYLEDTNSIEVYDGFAWVAGIPTHAVTTTKIGDLAVTTAKIDTHAVTTTKIGDLAVTTAKIDTHAVTTTKIGDLAVTPAKIAEGAVTADKIDTHAVTTTKIGDLAVTPAKIAEGAVTADKIADQAVTGPKIAPDAVTFSKIADSSVGAAKITGAAISAFERSGATVEASVPLVSAVRNIATVTLNIPSAWSSWDCVAFAQATADIAGSGLGDVGLFVHIDGTDGPEFDYQVPGPSTVAVSAASFRSGITTTGTRTIAFRGSLFSPTNIVLRTVFLYARAFRTS